MKSIILAAGRGSRMMGLTTSKPKCLVEVNGKPILDWQLEILKGVDQIDEIGIVTGYLNTHLKRENITNFYNSDWSNSNMVMSLLVADEWLSNYECIISYSDIIYESQTINILKACEGNISIVYDVNWQQLWNLRFQDPLSDAETFKLTQNKQYLQEIGNTASCVNEIEGQYMGLLKFTPNGWNMAKKVLDALPLKHKSKLHMTTLLQHLIELGYQIAAVPTTGRWAEIDTATDLKVAERIFRDDDL